jgi:hypothetical protein
MTKSENLAIINQKLNEKESKVLLYEDVVESIIPSLMDLINDALSR